MKSLLLALAASLALAACQSNTKHRLPDNVPPEENAAPRADTTGQVR